MNPQKYLISALWCFASFVCFGQQTGKPIQSAMTSDIKNFRTFTHSEPNTAEEVQQANKDYLEHPELGKLFAEAPCSDCYELIGKRTEKSKTFVALGADGKDIMLQTSTDAMHYRGRDGEWLTVKDKLVPAGVGVYAATEQPVPVTINTKTGFTSLGAEAKAFSFNNNLELVFRQPDGSEVSLGAADWSNLTAGDDGIYVTNMWSGIDMEVSVARGATKTNFYVNHALPAYAHGALLVRDHLKTGSGLKLSVPESIDYKGNIEVTNSVGATQYYISAATAYEQNNIESTLQMVGYDLKGDVLDIVLPGSFLDRAATAYPVVIDPLVSTATSSTVGGSSYSPGRTVGCYYVNAATVPAGVTVTDVRWSFNYTASGGALLLNGAADYTLGSCRSPGVSGFFWYCNLASAGTCTGTNVSIFSDIRTCIAPPQCTSYPMNLSMRFYQNYASTTPCATTYITAGSPLTVTVFGHTAETSPITSAGGISSICRGQSVTMATTPSYGVPPYAYVWNPGGAPGNPVVLTPTVTTAYTVTVSDACGQTATANKTIIVTTIPPVSGNDRVCTGGTVPYTNPAVGGSWTSSAPSVATVGISSGIVTGVSAGTADITYTTPAGCYATKVITVMAMPPIIPDSVSLCAGATVTLTNSMPGGTWSSVSAAIATIGSSSGLLSAVSSGTATISYTTSPGCSADIIVTVHPNPIISGISSTDPTACFGTDGTITLSGLVAGDSYVVDYLSGVSPVSTTIVADGSGNVVVTGLSAGVYSGFVVNSVVGCSGAWSDPITLSDIGAPPVPVAGSNSPVCEGASLLLTATSSAGVTYRWTGPAGFSSTLQNPSIAPAGLSASGEYSVTATWFGCVSLPATVNVIVNQTPQISTVEFTNPTTCHGNEGTMILNGLLPATTYDVKYLHDGVLSTITITADGTGRGEVTGLSAGTYSSIFVVNTGCPSAVEGPITLVDPAAPPPPEITSNAPICEGLTLNLKGKDATPGGTFSWTGPNGFTANTQDASIPNVSADAQGMYTLSYTILNCTSTTTKEINLQPIIRLDNVTATRYELTFGDSVKLNASGAKYYIWTPHDKTLSDYYIPSPWAKPVDSITRYMVIGINDEGCRDSAYITLTVLFEEQEFLPNAFTPNGDGKNDVFRVGNMRFKQLVEFVIYNRWGQLVYRNPYDPNSGWDGSCGGVKAEMGVYFYNIVIEYANGKRRQIKGDVTLIR